MIRILQFYMIAIAFSFNLERLFNRICLPFFSSRRTYVCVCGAFEVTFSRFVVHCAAVALTPVADVGIYLLLLCSVSLSPSLWVGLFLVFSFIAENMWPFSVSIFNTANKQMYKRNCPFIQFDERRGCIAMPMLFLSSLFFLTFILRFLLIFHFNLYNYFIYITSFKPNVRETYYSPCAHISIMYVQMVCFLFFVESMVEVFCCCSFFFSQTFLWLGSSSCLCVFWCLLHFSVAFNSISVRHTYTQSLNTLCEFLTFRSLLVKAFQFEDAKKNTKSNAEFAWLKYFCVLRCR